MKKFKGVCIVHHTATWTSLIEEELLLYLKNKVDKIFYVTHPFKNSRDNLPLNTKFRVYKNGKLYKEVNWLSSFGPEAIFFVKDFIFNIFYFLFKKEKIDIFFGMDNLDAMSGIILKRFGKVKKVVYYVIDYVPKRFNSPLLNRIYHWVDFYCVKNADQVWNLSSEMARARLRDGLDESYSKKQITVPVGCHPLKIKTNRHIKKKIVFLGNLTKDQGVEMLIEAIPKVITKIPYLKLIVIGSGSEDFNLKNKVEKLKMERFVEFKGFVKDNNQVNKLLTNCYIGIAPYSLSSNSFKHFTDPGKIKTYLGAGLPVVMTNVSHIAGVINKKGAGLIIRDDADDIAKAIIKILSDYKLYSRLRINAIILSKEFNWNKIFKKSFNQLLKR